MSADIKSEARDAFVATIWAICALLWGALLVVGTAVLVFAYGHSGWWWLLTLWLLCFPAYLPRR